MVRRDRKRYYEDSDDDDDRAPSPVPVKKMIFATPMVVLYSAEIFREAEKIEQAIDEIEKKAKSVIYKCERKSLLGSYKHHRRREKEEMDIDAFQIIVENECYGESKNPANGYSPHWLEWEVRTAIMEINHQRFRKKPPITIHNDENAVFDITRDEVEEFVVNYEPLGFRLLEFGSVERRAARRARRNFHRVNSVYDYLEEKYKKEPIVEEDVLTEEETLSFDLELGETLDIEDLKKAGRRYDLIIKSVGTTVCTKTMDFLVKQKESCEKSIKLMEQMEKLKNHTKSYPQFKKERLEELVKKSELVIRSSFSTNLRESLENVVDQVYLFFMERREDNGEDWTCYTFPGECEREFESVQEVVKHVRQIVHGSEGLLSVDYFDNVIYHQLIERDCMFRDKRLRGLQRMFKFNKEIREKEKKDFLSRQKM